jgi:hypothetical protein
MKTRYVGQVIPWAVLGLLLIPGSILAHAVRTDKHAIPFDSIDVIGHLDLTNKSVTRLATSEHWRREFLELQDPTHRMLTLVDVTDVAHPAVVKQLHLPRGAANSNLAAMVGDVGLLAGTSAPPAIPQTSFVSVVSFTDPNHPATVRKFNDVTAFRMDEGRGLIYLVNQKGLWILREKPAPDRALERAYANYVLYNH